VERIVYCFGFLYAGFNIINFVEYIKDKSILAEVKHKLKKKIGRENKSNYYSKIRFIIN